MKAPAGEYQRAHQPDPACTRQTDPLAVTIADIREHPDLQRAIAFSATGMIEIYCRDTILNRIVNDRGRLVGSIVALYLHFTPAPDGKPHGLTLGRFQATCVRLNICSPGRAQAFLAMLQLVGYLVAKPDGSDRRQRPLLPTDRLIEVHRQRWRHQFRAMAPVLPQARRALDALDRPDFLAAFLRHLGSLYLDGFRILRHAPELEGIVESNAGLLVVFSLITAVNGTVPPEGIVVPVSKSGLSMRFGTARAHTRGLLRRMAASGLIGHTDVADAVIVLPKLMQAVSRFFAAGFVALSHSAEAALRDCAATSQGLAVRTCKRPAAGSTSQPSGNHDVPR